MSNSSKVRCEQHNGRERWLLGVPSTVAKDMGLTGGDNVEWIVVDEDTVVLRRTDEPFLAVKKNPATITRLF